VPPAPALTVTPSVVPNVAPIFVKLIPPAPVPVRVKVVLALTIVLP
jgi:hypothetical protein